MTDRRVAADPPRQNAPSRRAVEPPAAARALGQCESRGGIFFLARILQYCRGGNDTRSERRASFFVFVAERDGVGFKFGRFLSIGQIRGGYAVENGNRSGGCGSGRPRRMSLKTTLFRRNDGSAVFEPGQFQKQNALRAVWAALIALTLCLAVARPASAAEPEAYEKAKVELSRLRGDEKRAQYRHSWLKIADDFMDVYESDWEWLNGPAALFRSAEALEEMARRSFVRKDAQNAAARFESVARKHPSSVLADDALYRAAVVRKELMRDDEGARSLLGTIGKKYAKSDYAPKAREYLAGLDGSAVASLGPAPVVKSVAEGARVAQITPQIKDKDVVRIVISVDKPVSWRIQHQAADSKSDRPARLTLDLTDATPGDKLKSGARYTKMGIFSRYAVDYTASQGKTRILLDFDKLQRYTVRAEKSPFRIIIEDRKSVV